MLATWSASSLQRVMACPSSEHLPKVNSQSEAATLGNEHHAVLASRTDAGDFGEGWNTETKFVYNAATRTARIVPGSDGSRDYGKLEPFEIPCTLDRFRIIEDDFEKVAEVDDWKTGFSDVRAAGNAQLMLQALCVHAVFGVDKIKISIAKTFGKDPSALSAEDIHFDVVAIDALDLDVFADRVANVFVQVSEAKKNPSYNEGAHCKFCPGRLSCPSKVGAVAVIAEMPLGTLITHDTIGQYYDKVQAAKAIIRDYERQLRWFVDNDGPVALPGNRMFMREVSEGNEKLDAGISYDAIAEAFGKSVADVAMVKTVSKASIERSLKAVSKPPKEAKKLFQVIRERGGASRSTSVEYIERAKSKEIESAA